MRVTPPQAKVRLTASVTLAAAKARAFGMTVPKRTKTVTIGSAVVASTVAGKAITVKVRLTAAFRTALARAINRGTAPAATPATLKLVFAKGKLQNQRTKTISLRR